MPGRKPAPVRSKTRNVDVPVARRAAPAARSQAKAAPKRKTRAPREKTFRLPDMETPPAIAAPRSLDIMVPFGAAFADTIHAHAIVEGAQQGLRRSLGNELERIGRALDARVMAVSQRLDDTLREISRVRDETDALRETPLNVVLDELRHQLDAVHPDPGR